MTNLSYKDIQKLGENPGLLKPLGNYCIVKLHKAEKSTQGGVLLPDQVVEQDKQMLARVVAVGPGQKAMMDCKPVGMFVKEGDLVVLLRYAPIEIKLGKEVCHVISEGDIIAVIDESKLKVLLEEEENNPSPPPVEEVVEDPMDVSPGGIFFPR